MCVMFSVLYLWAKSTLNIGNVQLGSGGFGGWGLNKKVLNIAVLNTVEVQRKVLNTVLKRQKQPMVSTSEASGHAEAR